VQQAVHENFETDAAAVREVEVKEMYDREADGWTRELGTPRFLETRYSLFVSQNESVFEELQRRVPWPWWTRVFGRDSHEPLHWIDVFSFDQLDTAREKFQNWQHALFQGGPTNIGHLMLTHRDPQFMRARLQRIRPRPPYRLPYHTDRRS
jgi:hypothetical protein